VPRRRPSALSLRRGVRGHELLLTTAASPWGPLSFNLILGIPVFAWPHDIAMLRIQSVPALSCSSSLELLLFPRAAPLPSSCSSSSSLELLLFLFPRAAPLPLPSSCSSSLELLLFLFPRAAPLPLPSSSWLCCRVGVLSAGTHEIISGCRRPTEPRLRSAFCCERGGRSHLIGR